MVKPKYIVSPDVLRLADINIVRLKAGTQPRIDPAKVSNLFALSLQSISASETELRGWFMQLWGGDDRQFPKENALGIALQRAKEKFQRLNKRRGSEGVEFLSIAFELPSVKLVGAEVGSVVAQQREAEDRPNSPERQLQATMFDQEERCQRLIDLEGQLASMHQLYANQVSECDALKMIVERARDTTTKLRKERDVAQFKLLRATQKVHRERTRALEKQRAIKNLRAAAHRQKNNIEKKVGLVSDVSRKLKAASERIAQRDNEVRQRDQIIDAVAAQCSENPEIATKVGSAYSPQVRQMCIQLIADKVPLENVPHVIETVLSFAGKRLAEVPSERTVRRIAGPECLSLSQAHVAEALSSAGDLTLQTDETSKFGQQFLATAVRTKNFGENRLHKAVLADLKEPLFMSELKVLALIGKVVTSPLWRLLESEIHVLDMNLYFSRLLSWLDESAADPTDFLSGVSGPFDEHLRDDAVFRKLIAPHECDAGAVAIASLTLSALAGLVRRLCADQLPGGRYFAPDDALRQMTASVPLHNKTPEAVFGFLDHLMTRRPNASMIVNEALIMFCKNKTSAWLASKTPEQTEALVRSAQLDAKQLRAIYKERSRALKEAAIAKLVQKQLKHSHQLLHAAQMKEKLTAEIMADGLWQTINEVDSRLSFISGDRKKVLALRKQLRFREKVLRQPPPNRESKDFVGKRFEHRLVNFATGEEQWLAGTVIGIVPGQNELFNVAYDSDPDIIHKFRLKEDLESNNLRVF
uniref:Uncharacterized protein n=1 Tax=Plectus sambesii TaxID=2011161 RepID=A0A914WIN5_9BILA